MTLTGLTGNYAVGLNTARSEIGFFDGEHVLIVERFDRLHTDQEVIRLHQEDLAQATGTAALNKYERDNGPNTTTIYSVFDQHLSPDQAREAKRQFAESLVFAWIIGHNDGHSKNYSITHLPGESFLSPLYDLNSILPFQTDNVVFAKDYRAYDQVQLAFTVGSASTIGGYSKESMRILERDAHLPAGHLDAFAVSVAASIGVATRDAIGTLPPELHDLPAVKKYPYIAYAQSIRVKDTLSQD